MTRPAHEQLARDALEDLGLADQDIGDPLDAEYERLCSEGDPRPR